MAGAEPSRRSWVGHAFRRLPLGSGAFREVRVASVSHFEEARPGLFLLLREFRQLADRDAEGVGDVPDRCPGRIRMAGLDVGEGR